MGLIAAAFVGFLIYDMVTKVQPDYSIGVISSYSIPSGISEQLSAELEKYGCDRNGDGDVVVQVNVYEIAQGEAAENTDPNMQMVGYVKLSGDLQTGNSYIFLTDDASFVAYGTEEGVFSYLDGSIPEEGATDYENMRLPVSECKGLAGTEIGEIFTDYSFSLRQIRDDLLEDDPQYYLGFLQYASRRILAAVDEIQAHDPTAIIILQSDHGARNGLPRGNSRKCGAGDAGSGTPSAGTF